MASGPKHGGRARSRSVNVHRDRAVAPERTLTLSNHQRLLRVDLRLLRRIAQTLLRETWPDGGVDLAIHIVTAPTIARLNETFLRHQGSTDVITFDYSESVGQASRLSPRKPFPAAGADTRDACPTLLHGEIFVCLDEALAQSRRFRTTWQSELVRYVVHGVLHLLGYDDQETQARRKMKRAEDALVSALAGGFDLQRLAR